MRTSTLLSVLVLAAGPVKAQTAILTSLSPDQLVALNQANVCPVDLTETPVPLGEERAPRTVLLKCMAGVEVAVANLPARAHDLLGGQLTLTAAGENPLLFRDDFKGIWLGRLEGNRLLLRPDAPRGYFFEVEGGSVLVFKNIVAKSGLASILRATRQPAASGIGIGRHEDLPANVRETGAILETR